VAYGSAIFQRRISTSSCRSIVAVRNLIDELLRLEGSGSDAIRKQFTADICNALPGLLHVKSLLRILKEPLATSPEPEPRPSRVALVAAAAATGRVELAKLNVLSSGNFLMSNSMNFPCALHAAVANGQAATVIWILDHIRDLYMTPENYSTVELGEALQVAVRTFNKEIGGVILDFLFTEQELLGYYVEVEGAVVDCIIHGSMDLFPRILEYRTAMWSPLPHPQIQYELAMSELEIDILFRRGSRKGLIALIQNRILNPNKLGSHLPLDRALHCYRLDLALALVDYGVNINQRNDQGQSALQLAATRGYMPNVKFLIEYGADPRAVTSDFEDVVELCNAAATHAQTTNYDCEAWRLFMETISDARAACVNNSILPVRISL
jgi:hypothetical protein